MHLNIGLGIFGAGLLAALSPTAASAQSTANTTDDYAVGQPADNDDDFPIGLLGLLGLAGLLGLRRKNDAHTDRRS